MLHWAMFGQPDDEVHHRLAADVARSTTGWPSWPRSAPVDCDQIICSLSTLSVLMSLRSLWRVSLLSRPGAGH